MMVIKMWNECRNNNENNRIMGKRKKIKSKRKTQMSKWTDWKNISSMSYCKLGSFL